MLFRTILHLGLTLALVFVCASLSVAGGIRWRTNLDSAMKEAKASNKLCMVFVYADYCDWCNKMKAETFVDPKVVEAVQSVIPVRINYDQEGREFGKKHQVKGFPVFIFLDSTGSKFGELFGYVPPTLFRDEVTKFADAYEAWPILSKELAQNPSDGELNARAAWFYGIRRDSNKALNHLKKAESARYRGRHLSPAYNMIGDIYQLSDDCSEAIGFFKKAVYYSKTTSDKAYGLVSIASCYRALGNLELMEKFATELINLKGAPAEYVEFARQMIRRKERSLTLSLATTKSNP